MRAKGQTSRFRHGSRKLTGVIRMATYLKGGPDSLSEVIERSLHIASPSLCTWGALDFRAGGLPSASLTRRYELSLDLAIMLMQRETAGLDGEHVRYSWADASPIGGADWLWSQYHEILSDKLAEAFSAVCELHEAVASVCAAHRGLQEGLLRRSRS